MSRILKFSQKLVLTQYTFDNCTFQSHLRTRLNILALNGTFSTSVIYGGSIHTSVR